MTHDSTDSKENLLKQIFHLPETNNAKQKPDEKLTQAVMKSIYRGIWLRNILSLTSIVLISAYILLQALVWFNSFDLGLILSLSSFSNDTNQVALITDSTLFYPAIVLLLGLFLPNLVDRVSP